jgi:hypothetical protein
MAYEGHIELQDSVLAYDDWLKGVEAVEGVRLYSIELYEKDPDLKQPFPFHPPEGTAEMQFDDQWIPVFYWSSGSVNFKFGEYLEEVFETAFSLAKRMNAGVYGEDQSEPYQSHDDFVQRAILGEG